MPNTNALHVLHNRVSVPSLQAPAPQGEVLENIMRSALRAADHKMLRPWRFLLIEGDSLVKLGALFVDAKLATGSQLDSAEQVRLAVKPKRAPMIMVAIACCQDNPKVPVTEQLISTGCAVQNMLNAAFAQGVGAMWRTGDMAYDPLVKAGLGLNAKEKIVGFLYLGTPKGKLKSIPKFIMTDYFQRW